MSVIVAESQIAYGRRPLWLLVRSTGIVPTLVGGLVGLAAIITQISRGRSLTETYALALVTSTAGLGVALDDPAAETVAASPMSLARRRAIRVLIAVTITIGVWFLIAAVVAASSAHHFPTADIVIEIAALSAIGLAAGAAVQRRTDSPGGPTAALVVLVGPAFMSAVAFRDVRVFPSLVPGQPLRERWVWLTVLALSALISASRDRASRHVRGRRLESRRG